MGLIHISDTHISDSNEVNWQIYQFLVENKWVHQWSQNRYKIIIHTGDFINHGIDSEMDKEFETAVDWINTLQQNGYKVLAVPGNHDYRWLGQDAVWGPNKQPFIDNILVTTGQVQKKGDSVVYPQVFPNGDFIFILLDSNSAQFEAHGNLDDGQLLRLKGILDECPNPDPSNPTENKIIVVALHHRPFSPIFHPLDNDAGLYNAQKFLEIIQNKVNILLFGHKGDIVQEKFEREERIYSIPVINGCNMEHMDETNGKISFIYGVSDDVVVLPTDPKVQYPNGEPRTREILNAYVREGTHHITPIVTRSDPVIYNCEDAAPYVKFQTGDIVTMTIGGCVQRGGKGNTWQRYVNPITEKGDSDNLHYGSIYIPKITGEGLIPIFNLVKEHGVCDEQSPDKCTVKFNIPNINDLSESERFLKLLYVDEKEAYYDNGYWNPDPGPKNQCKGVESAYLDITIRRNTEWAWLPLLLD